MGTPLTRRFFETVQDDGFSKAKKLADLHIRRSVNVAGKPTLRGYQEGIAVLERFQFSDNEKVSLDAQRLIQRYSNEILKLQNRQRETNKTVGEFKINEREAFYVTPTTQFRGDTMLSIPEVVSDTAEELRQIVFAVSTAIDERELIGESTAELEKYYFEILGRYRMMEELNNDLLNGEISQEQALNGFGVFVDSDQNDGSMNGIMVAPIGNLPQGFNQGDYARLESSVDFGGGNIPVFSRFSTDELGVARSRIGTRVWTGDGKFALRYDRRQSEDRGFREKPGALNFAEFVPPKTSPIRPGRFFRGFTGFREDGNPVESLFFTSHDGQIYSVDDEARQLLSRDFANEINNSVGVDSEFARGVLQSESVQPLRFTPQLKEAQPPSITPSSQAVSPEEPRQSIFERAREHRERQPVLFDRVNRPNIPDEPQGTSFTALDIIDKGRSFFQKRTEELLQSRNQQR